MKTNITVHGYLQVNLNSSIAQELTKKIRKKKSKSSIVYIVKKKNNNNKKQPTGNNKAKWKQKKKGELFKLTLSLE